MAPHGFRLSSFETFLQTKHGTRCREDSLGSALGGWRLGR